MEKGKYANLTTRELQKRKKFAFVLSIILIAAVVLDGSALIYNLFAGKGFKSALFIVTVACLVVCMPILSGKKMIEEELKKRKDNNV